MKAILLAIAALVLLLLLTKRGGGTTGAMLADYENQAGDAMQGGTNKIAQAIAKMEGYGIPGAIPTRTNNPGDIGTYNGKVRSYPDAASGFSALSDYVNSHATANPSWDFYDFFHYYLTGDTQGTPGPGQNPDGYADYVAGQVGVDATTPLSQVIG